MKKKIIESIKIVVGTILGTGIVMYSMWFMLDMVLHPFMIILLLIVLFVVGIIISGVTMGYKGIIVVLGSFIFGLWGFSRYYNYTCNPNQADVEVMRPMAEKISDYIVKNGIPRSLKDIPDLPYKLKECKKEITYRDENDQRMKYIPETLKREEKMEICTFKNITIRFRLDKNLKEKDAKWDGSLRMRSSSDTALYNSIEQNQENKFIFNNIRFSGKKSGMCKAWRQ